jgi:parallel beta-helix repeat protein
MKNAISLAVLMMLILCTLASSFNIRYVKAWSGDITIKSDGGVDPPTAPVNQIGNVYYLTDDVQGSITIEVDNIVVNGMGHTIQYTGTSPKGIDLESRTNVKIMNMGIENFISGVYLFTSNQNNISQVNVTGNSGYGIYLYSSSNNNLLGNSITANIVGIFLDYSSTNIISENQIESNSEGVYTRNSVNNRIFHNNLVDNSEQAHAETSADAWDDGYPSGGNYWNNYTGVDQKCGPSQDHPGSDGIGDAPYVVDSNNQDNYPLMNPWTPLAGHNIAVVSVVPKTVIFQGFSGNMIVYGANKGEYPETFNVTVYARTTSVGSVALPLESGSTINITLSWNTTGFAKGNYTISADARPVPGETDTADNNFTDGWVVVTMVGDLTGGSANPWDFVPDGKCDGKDIGVVARCYGSKLGSLPPEIWNANCDVNNDGKVDGKDIAIVARHYGQADP